jgi:hypothetical protein
MLVCIRRSSACVHHQERHVHVCNRSGLCNMYRNVIGAVHTRSDATRVTSGQMPLAMRLIPLVTKWEQNMVLMNALA